MLEWSYWAWTMDQILDTYDTLDQRRGRRNKNSSVLWTGPRCVLWCCYSAIGGLTTIAITKRESIKWTTITTTNEMTHESDQEENLWKIWCAVIAFFRRHPQVTYKRINVNQELHFASKVWTNTFQKLQKHECRNALNELMILFS